MYDLHFIVHNLNLEYQKETGKDSGTMCYNQWIRSIMIQKSHGYLNREIVQ